MLKEVQKDICNELVESNIKELEEHIKKDEDRNKDELLRALLELPNYKEV